MSEEIEDIAGTVAGKLEVMVPSGSCSDCFFLCMAHRDSLRCVTFIFVPVSVPLFWYLWDRMDILALSSNIKLIFPDH